MEVQEFDFGLEGRVADDEGFRRLGTQFLFAEGSQGALGGAASVVAHGGGVRGATRTGRRTRASPACRITTRSFAGRSRVDR